MILGSCALRSPVSSHSAAGDTETNVEKRNVAQRIRKPTVYILTRKRAVNRQITEETTVFFSADLVKSMFNPSEVIALPSSSHARGLAVADLAKRLPRLYRFAIEVLPPIIWNLARQIGRRGIRLLLSLLENHTSHVIAEVIYLIRGKSSRREMYDMTQMAKIAALCVRQANLE